jgi:hypothetical protein
MNSMYSFVAAAALLQDESSFSLGGVVHALPRDLPSLFALGLLVIGAGAVLWYGRPRGGGQRSE